MNVYELLFDYIEFSVDYLKFFKENQHLIDIAYRNNNNEIFLLDSKCAILLSYYEVFLSLKRILGYDERVAKYYILNGEVLKKVKLKGVSIDKCCKEVCYKSNNMTKLNFPTVIIANFIDLFFTKGGFSLIIDIIVAKASINT